MARNRAPGTGGDRLEVRSRSRAGGATVQLAGELTIATADRLRLELEATEASGPTVLVLDLRAVTFLDSMALGALIAAHKRSREAGRRLVFVTATGPVARLLEVTGLDRSLEVADEPPQPGGMRRP